MKNNKNTIFIIVGLIVLPVLCILCVIPLIVTSFAIFRSTVTNIENKVTENNININSNKYKIKELVKIQDVEIEVNSVDTNYKSSNRLFLPNDGNKIVLIELTVKNNRSTALSVSSVLNFKIQDDKGNTFGSVPGDRPSLNSIVGIGKTSKGFISFEVSTKTTKLDLVYIPDYMSKEQIVFALN